jgi:hypothetical protein
MHPQLKVLEEFTLFDDKFLMKNMIIPGDTPFTSTFKEWFSTKKKHVFIDGQLHVIFVGGNILKLLVAKGV